MLCKNKKKSRFRPNFLCICIEICELWYICSCQCALNKETLTQKIISCRLFFTTKMTQNLKTYNNKIRINFSRSACWRCFNITLSNDVAVKRTTTKIVTESVKKRVLKLMLSLTMLVHKIENSHAHTFLPFKLNPNLHFLSWKMVLCSKLNC